MAAFLHPKTVSASTAEAEIVAKLESCAARLEAGSNYESYVVGFAHAQEVVSGALEFMRSRVGPTESVGMIPRRQSAILRQTFWTTRCRLGPECRRLSKSV